MTGSRIEVGLREDEVVDRLGAGDVVDAEILPRRPVVLGHDGQDLHLRRVVAGGVEDQLVWPLALDD